jgi:AcrR family transcriptional regulator
MAAVPARATRSHNRLPLILDQAAQLFRERGYEATSVRDIVRLVGMLPGSLYYHFPSKEALLAAVYAEGRRRIAAAVTEAVAGKTDPWERLEAGCIAHLESILRDDNYAQVIVRVRPSDAPAAAAELVSLRDSYERIFVTLVEDLPLPSGADRRALRLMLLGALNWSQTWYRPGRDSPRAVARRFVALLKRPLA